MTPALRGPLRRLVVRAVSLTGGGAEDGLRILTYHRVNPHHPSDRLTVHPDSFRRQLEEILRSGAAVVGLGDGLARLDGGHEPPRAPVALTFDDGYEDNVSQALPILEEFGVPATFFLATGLVGTRKTLDRYQRCCNADGMMSWDQARELVSRGHTVGGHGHHHLELDRLGPEALAEEVTVCSRTIGAHLGALPRLFCYPRGRENRAVRRVVAAAGYDGACTVVPGVNGPGQDPMTLRRTEVSGDDDLDDFRLKLAGGFDAWHRLVQLRRRAS